jgi:hypothetical protein
MYAIKLTITDERSNKSTILYRANDKRANPTSYWALDIDEAHLFFTAEEAAKLIPAIRCKDPDGLLYEFQLIQFNHVIIEFS